MTVKSADLSEISIWISLTRGQSEERQAIMWRLYTEYIALLFLSYCILVRIVFQAFET